MQNKTILADKFKLNLKESILMVACILKAMCETLVFVLGAIFLLVLLSSRGIIIPSIHIYIMAGSVGFVVVNYVKALREVGIL